MLKKELNEVKILIKSIPSVLFAFFVVALITMNLLANKSINLPFKYLALDCGFIISWVAFLVMDLVTKHFGLKAGNILSLIGVLVNLFVCFIFFITSLIPGVWSESYVSGSEIIINSAIDKTFGGTWYVLLGSTIAFLVSAFVNNFINASLGKMLKNKDSAKTFMVRTYLSTCVGQFIDNFVFALIVSHVFFGWSMIQCVTCAFTGMIVELLLELIFAPIGYKICKKWKEENVGIEYLKLRGEK